MSTLVAQHHHNAAEHLTQAAFHHKQAQHLQEAGNYKDAAHHACLARAHLHYAEVFTFEAEKAYLDVHSGRSRVATV